MSKIFPSSYRIRSNEGLGNFEHTGMPELVSGNTSLKALPISWRPWIAYEKLFYIVAYTALSRQLAYITGLLSMLQDPTLLLNDSAWQQLYQIASEEFQPHVESLALFAVEQVRNTAEGAKVSINWSLINQDAVNVSNEKIGQQITAINDVTREAIAKLVKEWVAEGESLSDLIDEIATLTDDSGVELFSEERAERIAVTEATNLYAEANSEAWVKLGYAEPVFKPSAHVRCRCYLQPKIIDELKVLVWYTAHDERVCVRDIDTGTELGVVQGCRGLHGVVVSKGEMLGKRTVEFEVEETSVKGGEGSGNFGHQGRPGLVGGSAPEEKTYKKFPSSLDGKYEADSWGWKMFDESKLDRNEVSALWDYKGNEYLRINNNLRGGYESTTNTKNKINAIDSALEKSTVPEDIYTFRGIRRGVFGKVESYVGIELTDKAFVSTTLIEREGVSWSLFNGEENPLVMRIEVPKGSSAIYMDVNEITDKGSEQELLLPRDLTFRIVSEENKTDKNLGKYTLITAEIVNGN